MPTNVEIEANGSDSLTIKWGPPLFPNGNITSYNISGIIQRDKEDPKINYCNSKGISCYWYSVVVR